MKTSSLQLRLRSADRWVVERERDLSYIRFNNDDCLVSACDSSGGIGPKSLDTVFSSGYNLGRFVTRVALLEVISVGANPFLVINNLTVERVPTGEEIIAGVLAECAMSGIEKQAVTGSTEDNVMTVSSGVGVTIVGEASISQLRVGTSPIPFAVLMIGRPMSAPRDIITPNHPEILNIPALKAALQIEGVFESLPIGSHGAEFEFEQLCASVGAVPKYEVSWPVERNQSGGPSTAALLSVDLNRVVEIQEQLSVETELPIWLLGTAYQ